MPVSIHKSLFTALVGAGLLAELPLSVAGGLDVGDFKNYSDRREVGGLGATTRHPATPGQSGREQQNARQPNLEEPKRRSIFQGVDSLSDTQNIDPKPGIDRQEAAPRQDNHGEDRRSQLRLDIERPKRWSPTGTARLFAKENRWGSAVKIQRCYGDNVMTVFSVTDKGQTGDLRFQFKNATFRNRGRRRHKWRGITPSTIMRGRTIFLRARSSNGKGMITLQIKGNCIENAR